MKTFARTLILFTIITLSFSVVNAQSGVVDEIITTAFPGIYSKTDFNNKTYDNSQKDTYRDLYFKIDKACGIVEAFELGAVDANTIEIFDYQLLKKVERSDSLDYLKVLLKDFKKGINDYMKWNEKLAADSINVAIYWTSYRDNLTAKKYNEAYKFWKILFENYPIISSSIYTGGAGLVKIKIENATDSITKLAYIDTLFMVYTQEIKAYPDREAYVKAKMAVDFYNYFVNDQDLNDSIIRTKMWKNYNMCIEAIELGGDDTKYYVFPITMKLTLFEYQLDSITNQTAIDNYLKFSEILKKQYDAETDADKKEKIKKAGIAPVDMIFTQSDLSTCDNLCATFRPRFEDDPTNPDNLKKILTIMGQKNCIEYPLYTEAAVALYNVEPSASSAYSLALLYVSQENYTSAAEFFDKAIAQETVDTLKATYCFKAAQLYNKQNQYSKAREYARQAFSLNPNNGNPLLLIATMYAATANSVGSDAFEHQAVYWAAVDKCYQAKNADPSVASVANQYINNYTGKFPSQEEAFMRSIQPNDSYTVGGWIGETTSARFNN
ncbi:MAG: hypothetical protein JXR68_12625 [Bacteroidales bacterium]|nr:hypothetical protein [Bacteroidales bacterium]